MLSPARTFGPCLIRANLCVAGPVELPFSSADRSIRSLSSRSAVATIGSSPRLSATLTFPAALSATGLARPMPVSRPGSPAPSLPDASLKVTVMLSPLMSLPCWRA